MRRGLAVLALSCLLAGCATVEDLWRTAAPSDVDRIGEATFVITTPTVVRCGQGVFVGCWDEEGEHVYFLTARHVVTSDVGGVSDSRLRLWIGWRRREWFVRAAKDRWMTTDRNLDFAWFELDAEERESLRKVNGLRYVPLTATPNADDSRGIAGTGTVVLLKYLESLEKGSADVTMFLKSGPVSGTMPVDKTAFHRFKNRYNQEFTYSTNLVVSVISKPRAAPGDSGGAVFVRTGSDEDGHWMLAGLITGGNDKKKSSPSLVSPLDVVFRDIRESRCSLAGQEDLW